MHAKLSEQLSRQDRVRSYGDASSHYSDTIVLACATVTLWLMDLTFVDRVAKMSMRVVQTEMMIWWMLLILRNGDGVLLRF